MRRSLLSTVPLGAAALLFASPLALLVLGSLRGRGLPPPRGLELLPLQPSLEAYTAVSSVLPIDRYLANSLIVAALAVPLTVLVASLAGFGIRLLDGRTARRVVIATLVVMLVPTTAVWATRFEVFRLVGAVDTFVPLVGLGLMATNPFLVLVYVFSFHRMPAEQLEAARLDGAGPLRAWWSVAMPQVRPATLAVVVLAFTFHWSNFIDPLLYLRDQAIYTAPLGVRLLQLLNPTDWPLLLAAGVLLTVPVVAVFLWGQRAFLHDPVHALDTEARS